MPKLTTIHLLWPDKDLNPNRARNLHWRKIWLAKADYREDCGNLAIEARQHLTVADRKDLLEKPVLASVTFVLPDRRRRDEDNLRAMLKPAWDGFQDANLIVGDHVGVFRVESAVEGEWTDGWRPGPGEVVVKLSV